MNLEAEKKKIRDDMRLKLSVQTDADRASKSSHITAKVRKDSGFQNSNTILFYINTPEEVYTDGLIADAFRRGVRVLLPLATPEHSSIAAYQVKDLDHLVKSVYGIFEPDPSKSVLVNSAEIDLVVVPGLAFDDSHYRLGRGKGYYDRFLAKLPRHIKTFGLAYDFQMVKSLPVTELDFPVTRVFHN